VTSRAELVRFLDELLDARTGRDYGPNGLQVEGAAEVRKVATGVSACLELFEKARAIGADTVLVHHGIFWDGTPRALVGMQYHRVAELVRGDLNLIAYHLPLDRHPELGNNVLGAKALGLFRVEPFGLYEGLPIGARGLFPEPLTPEELVARCAKAYGREPLAFLAGPKEVRTVGVISGGAQREVYQAIDAGLDAYVTGEVSEWVMNVARESGIHYLSAGHYATEVLGIRALGEHVAARFGLEHEFIDVPNPV
jgi:dinuclear metal center YbgI/SA1388 family protein